MDRLSTNTLRKNNLLINTDINKFNIGEMVGKLKSIDGGEILYGEGDPSESVYMVLNGEINLVKRGLGGKSQSIIFSENDFFGAKELFANIDRCTKTVSLTDTYLVELSKDEIDYLIEQDERVALNIQKGNRDFKFSETVIEIRDNSTDAYKDFAKEKKRTN